MTTREAGEWSGLGERMVRRLVEERRLAFYRIRTRIRVSERDLNAYIEASRESARR